MPNFIGMPRASRYTRVSRQRRRNETRWNAWRDTSRDRPSPPSACRLTQGGNVRYALKTPYRNGIKPEQVFESSVTLKPGKYTLGMKFEKTGTGKHGESLGETRLYVDDKVVASGKMRTQPGKFSFSGEGLCVGYDSEDAVSTLYKAPGKFTGGKIQGVAVTVKGEPYVNLEAEAKRLMMKW
jgi:hypothetical protein